MPAPSRLARVFIVACFALLVAPSAWAGQSGTSPEERTAPPEDGQERDGQNLAVGNPSNNSEVSFFVGGLVGGDLGTLLSDGFSLGSTLENGRTYGGRVGYYTFPVGVEGSFAYAKSGLGATVEVNDTTRVSLGARVMYAEVNGLLILIPGPVQPFITGGGGLHSYDITDLEGVDVNKWGWNFGGGLKINIKRVSIRADVRDHLTTVTAADLNIDDELADLLGLTEQSLHNVEISFGVGFRF